MRVEAVAAAAYAALLSYAQRVLSTPVRAARRQEGTVRRGAGDGSAGCSPRRASRSARRCCSSTCSPYDERVDKVDIVQVAFALCVVLAAVRSCARALDRVTRAHRSHGRRRRSGAVAPRLGPLRTRPRAHDARSRRGRADRRRSRRRRGDRRAPRRRPRATGSRPRSSSAEARLDASRRRRAPTSARPSSSASWRARAPSRSR